MADSQKVALITGITGQDGSFLAEFCWIRGMRYTALSAAVLRSTPVASSTCISMNGCAT